MHKLSNLYRGFILLVLVTVVFALFPRQVMAQEASEPLQVDVSVNPESVVAGEPVTVQFDLSVDMGSVNCQSNVTRPLDIVLVVDTSGSMNESLGTQYAGNKLEGAVKAVNTFLGLMSDENDLAGLVGFSNKAKSYYALSRPSEVRGGMASFQKSAEADGGGTYIAGGMQQAVEILNQAARGTTAHAIILLTDGDTGAPGEASELAEQAKQEDIRVITIGLGDSINEPLLREMASEESDYYYVPETSELQAVYETISNSLEIVDAVTSINVLYQFDSDLFDLIEESVYPDAVVSYDQINWELPFMEDGNRQALRVDLMPKSNGNSYAAINFDVTYRLCDQQDIFTVSKENFLPITVAGEAEAYCPKLDESSEGVPFSLCQIPWGLIFGVLFLLVLVSLWALKHRDTFQFWERVAKKIKQCTMWDLPWRLLLAVFLGMLVHTFANYLCTPTSGAIFYREFQDRSSALYLQPFGPQGKTQQITELVPENERQTFHVVSEKNQAIYVVSYTNDTPRLIAYDFYGKRIGFAEVQGIYPALSPDESRIAYVSQNADIMILDLQTGAVEALEGASDPGLIETMPTWSADGTKIAFVRGGTSGQAITISVPCDIATVSSEGGVPVFVPGASNGGFNYSPAFSPDGKWLAFLHHTEGNTTYNDPYAEVRLVSAAGGDPVVIASATKTEVNGGNTWITWSQDSKSLMYSSTSCDGQYDIVRVAVDETGYPQIRERVGFASDSDSYEFGLQWTALRKPNLVTGILKTLPWLLLSLVLLALRKFLFCKKRKPEELEDTIIAEVSVNKDRGLLTPDERFEVSIDLCGVALCPPVIRDRKADVVMLLDTSGSMMGLPLRNAVAASKEFIRQIMPKSRSSLRRFAVLGFDDVMQEYQSLTGDRKNLLEAFDRVKTGGSTNMNDGLERAIDILVNDGRADARRVILLLTDGYPNDPEQVVNLAEKAQQENIKIFAVGFGDVYEELLEKIVGDEGKYQYIKNQGDQKALVGAFKTAAQDTLLQSPAKDVFYQHNYDPTRFEIVRGSVIPGPMEVNEEEGFIKWYLPEITEIGKRLKYEARPLFADVENDQFIDKYGQITYLRCEKLKKTMTIEPNVKVRVSGWNIADMKASRDPLEIKKPEIIWEPDQALFIGIGGVGRVALTYIKKNLIDAGAGELNDGIEFLVLDTDIYEKLGDRPVGFDIARTSIDEKDIFVLDENLQLLIESLGNTSHEEAVPYLSWFDPQEYRGSSKVNLATGTLGDRLLPRLALIRNLMKEEGLEKTSRWFGRIKDKNISPHFQDWVQERCERAHRKEEDGRNKLRVFIISSLAGGMSGTIIDVAYLVRKLGRNIVQQDGDLQVEGYFLDGSSFENIVPDAVVVARCKANSSACSRELARWQLNPGYPFPIEWDEAEGLKAPLFDSVSRFSRKSSLSGPDGLTKEICPEIADVITTRLDKAMGAHGTADWMDGIKSQALLRRQNEHISTVGLARSYSWRLPVADILNSIHMDWIDGFFREALNPLLQEDEIVNGSMDTIFNRRNLTDENITQVDPLSFVYCFFLGGGKTAFGGPAPLDSRYLANSFLALEDQQPISREEMQFDNEQIAQIFSSRIQTAIQYFLVGSEASPDGQIACRLNSVNAFLDSMQSTLQATQNDESQDPVIRKIAGIYLAAFNNMNLQEEIEVLQKKIFTKLDSPETAGNDMVHWLSIQKAALEETQTELDQIRSRKYFWDQILVDHVGRKNSKPFTQIWRAKYLEQQSDIYLPYLHCTYDAECGFDLVLNIESRVSLIQDGKEKMAEGLMRIAAMQTRDAWGETTLSEVMENNEVFADVPHGAKEWVTFSNWLQPGAGTGVSKKLYAIATKQTLEAAAKSIFLDNILQTINLGDNLYIGSSPLRSTDRFNFVLLHDIEAVGLDQLGTYNNERKIMLTLDGYNEISQQFSGAMHQRFVFGAEALIQRIERSKLLNSIKKLHAFHPLTVAGMQEMKNLKIYCIALAMGMIVENPRTNSIALVIRTSENNPEVFDLKVTPRKGISQYVDAMLNWTLGQGNQEAKEAIQNHFSGLSKERQKDELEHSYPRVLRRLNSIPDKDNQSLLVYLDYVVREYLKSGAEF